MGRPSTHLIQEMTDRVMFDVKPYVVGQAYQALCRMYPLVEITSKTQHHNALKVVEHIIDYLNRGAETSLANDLRQYLAVLGDLIDKYEKDHFKSEKAEGYEILAQLMEAHHLKQTDLSEELGGQSVVSLILSGQRELNIRQIRALAERFKVSPELFL